MNCLKAGQSRPLILYKLPLDPYYPECIGEFLNWFGGSDKFRNRQSDIFRSPVRLTENLKALLVPRALSGL